MPAKTIKNEEVDESVATPSKTVVAGKENRETVPKGQTDAPQSSSTSAMNQQTCDKFKRGEQVKLKEAPVAEKNKKFIGGVAIIIRKTGKGWYEVTIMGKNIKWRGKENMVHVV